MNRSSTPLVLIAAAAALWACSSAQDDWNKANAANTVTAYQEYLNEHPTGEHSGEAGDRIHSLQDQEAWSQATQANTADAYRDYLQNQLAGSHVNEAHDALTAAQRAADWKTAESTGTAAALQDFLKKYPSGAEVDQAHEKLTALASYKVKLATVKTQKQAKQHQERLRSKYGNILHSIVIVPNDAGKTYGLESTPMSQSEADSACTELKKAHQSCEVVKSELGKG